MIRIPNQIVRVEVTRKEPVQPSGYRRVFDHHEDVTCDVVVNEAMLRSLCTKAALNKTAKSKIGPLTVTVLSRRTV